MRDRGIIMNEEERLEIINWFCDNHYRMNRIQFGRIDYTLKETDESVPLSIWNIKKRIVEKEKLEDYTQEPKYKDFFGAIMPGGRIHKHTDDNVDGLIHTRFNVFIMLPTNDLNTYYSGKVVDAKERPVPRDISSTSPEPAVALPSSLLVVVLVIFSVCASVK
jgi:hypothetical protein